VISDYILSLDTEQSCGRFFKNVKESNHIEFAVRLTIPPTTTTTTTKTTVKTNIMTRFFNQSKTSKRIPLSTFRNVDTVEETSLASSSEFDDSEIVSITDSMHLAKNRGVKLSVEDDFDMGDEDLIECDSVHLTRQRVPECVWHEDDKNEDCDEFAEESPFHQADPYSQIWTKIQKSKEGAHTQFPKEEQTDDSCYGVVKKIPYSDLANATEL
jgi:hypothetical protein